MTLAVHILALLLAAAGPEPAEATEEVWSVVTVLPGSTMSTLAERFRVPEESLRAWNELDNGEPEVGRRLRVHSVVREQERFRLRFSVKEETTWRAIADRYELPLRTLLALNKRTRGGTISKGRRVTVYVPRDRWNGQWLDGGLQLEERPGLKVKDPVLAWGRPVVVRTLEDVADRIHERYPGSAVVVGDLSRANGGRLPPHSSHRGGLDADLGFFIPGEPFTVKFKHTKPSGLDVERTWFLVHSLLQSGRVKRILVDWYLQAALYDEAKRTGATPEQLDAWFQYPARRWKKTGIIRHYKGHKNHLHVRFAVPEGEVVL
jgi:LysM repeat protein